MGSELSAAGGRGSEVSEWPRSKFPASAVRQRRNFGHRNRIIGPYEICKERLRAGGVEPRPYESVTRRCGAGKNPPVTASPCQPPLGKGALGTGDGLPRVPCALAMTEAERICVSFRDQSADWSWESVLFFCLRRGTFAISGNSTQKRRSNLRFENPLRGFTYSLSRRNKPRERCAAEISPEYCIVPASWSAAAFTLKCRRSRFYRG